MSSSLHKKPLFFRILFFLIKKAHRWYYGQFRIEGLEYFDPQKPTIVVANHQNALMDAFIMMFALNTPIIFLTRADVFKQKRIANLLRYFKMLPVYRIRDGKEKLKLNEGIFNEAIGTINAGIPLGLFPEASQCGERKLRKLTSGTARLAFHPSGHDDIQVLPIGINYSHYFGASHDVFIKIGRPLSISDYKRLDISPAKQSRKFTADLEDRMRTLIIDLPAENYGIYDGALRIKEELDIADNKDIKDRFYKSQLQATSWSSALDKETLTTKLQKSNTEYRNLKASIGAGNLNVFYSDNVIDMICSIGLILLASPIIIAGWVINFIPNRLSKYFSRNFEDPHIVASADLGFYLVVFPTYYLILGIILSVLFKSAWAIPAIFLLGISALFLQKMAYRRLKRIRAFLIRKRHPNVVENLRKLWAS